jgi:hypothetical protein
MVQSRCQSGRVRATNIFGVEQRRPMSSPDRPDDKSGKDPAGAASAQDETPAPLERSPQGRFVIRSSSHPPGGIDDVGDARDVSGARSLPRSDPAPKGGEGQEGRPKRSTPAERPRRRKQVALERSLRDTLPARPQSLRSRLRGHEGTPDSSESEQLSDEEIDEAARLLVISADDDLTPASSTPKPPVELEPPPPAGHAALLAVRQSSAP